ncbi:MAG: zinc ribbon domain-containing protein, partial [Acidobacteriota bacterium]|nr:zinc ribbon domain-containing protein [Acidobacteriota bacterium]
MFCPNCAANNRTEQKFCRSCGLNLEKSAESLIEQFPNAQNASLLKQSQLIEKFGIFALGGLGIVGSIALIAGFYVLVTKVLVTGTNVFAMLL